MATNEPARVGTVKVERGRKRVDEYGVWEVDSYGTGVVASWAQYEGYTEDGWGVGLPLAGPNAAHLQAHLPLSTFAPGSIRYFDGRR